MGLKVRPTAGQMVWPLDWRILSGTIERVKGFERGAESDKMIG
jgi:hypothetical protein